MKNQDQAQVIPKLEDVTVLLIEDDEIDVMGIKRALGQFSMDNLVVTAADGIEALEKLRDGSSVPRPYLILLDLNMPRMNGLEFLQQTRQDPHLQDSLVFVLTTSSAKKDKDMAYRHNIAGYIVKDRKGGSFNSTINMLKQFTNVVDFPEAPAA